MFKRLSFLCLFLCFFGKIYAQKTNEDIIVPPKNTVYPENVALKIKEVYRANKHKIPKEKALKEMAINPNLPENLNEILQQFDWLEVAQYFFHPETPEYTLNDVRYNYLRHNPSKGLLEFEFMLPDDQQPTLTFMNNNANGKEIKEIRKMGTQFYYYDKTMVPQNRDDEMRRMKDPSKAYSPVVEYKDKLLVIDITFSAELGSAESPTRFRKVFMAIPKFFSLGEPKNPVISNPKTNNANTQNVSKNNISVYDDNTIYTKDQLIENGVPQKIKEVYKANKHKVPNEQTLKNMPLNTNLPNNLTDILYQNDWLEVARYMFSPDDSGYSGIEIQNTFKRFHSTKGILTFRFRLPNDQSPYPPRLEYVDNETNVPVTIRKNGTHFYYQDNKNEKDIDYSPMVDYKDGIMIIDFTESAKLNDFNNVRRSRSVFMAIPKFFSLGEQKNPVVSNQKPDNTTINNTTKINTNSNDKRLVNVSDAYDDNATYTKNQPIENGVAEKIKEVYNANKHKIPNEQTLKNMSLNTNLPNNLTDILYQNDWLDVGHYAFNPVEPGYSTMRTETRLRRFHSTKGILVFRFKLPNNDIYPPVVEYVDEMQNIPIIIRKTGTHFYYQNNRKPEVNRTISYYPVVDYKDGILIVDFTYSAALNDFNNVRRFRQVYMAIPKFFSLGEQKNPVVSNQKPDNTTINNTTKINTNSNDKRLVNVSDAYDDNATYTKNQPIENGVAEKIKEVYNANKHKIPNEQALKNMSLNTNLPNNLTDILYQTDWLEVGNYFFHPTEPGYSRMRTETRLRRFHSTKGILAFRFKLPDNDIYSPVVEYVDELNTIPVIIQKTGTHFYYQDNRKPEVNRKISYKPVVDYKDGILIVDFTYSEALNDFNNVRRFRQVLMAIPKQF